MVRGNYARRRAGPRRYVSTRPRVPFSHPFFTALRIGHLVEQLRRQRLQQHMSTFTGATRVAIRMRRLARAARRRAWQRRYPTVPTPSHLYYPYSTRISTDP